MSTHGPLFLFAMVLSLNGCGQLDTSVTAPPHEKSRPAPLAESDWPGIRAQDVAILLPRVEGQTLKAHFRTSDDRALLPGDWVDGVSAAFSPTDVGDALEAENRYEDWTLVSIRVSPCSPLGHVPGPDALALCWPEVRLVWQPTIYDFWIGWTTVDAFSDDRAIHALYRVYPRAGSAEVEALIESLTRGQGDTQQQLARLSALRREAVADLLGATVALRDPLLNPDDFSELDLRAETLGSDEQSQAFYQRLGAFLSTFAQREALHTLTAFSLPEGRDPAGEDIWVFLAFDGVAGQLRQRSIEVRSPITGDVLFDYGRHETVSSAQADHRAQAYIDIEPVGAAELTDQIVTKPNDRRRLHDRLNDPEQTLVANTSCASCHSFNDLTFNLHNLSYLQEMEISIAPRVRRDVDADLMWLRR
jgi:hypothetical protein